MTALHYMRKKGSDARHFRMLIEHGARGDIPNGKGETAAEIMGRKRNGNHGGPGIVWIRRADGGPAFVRCLARSTRARPLELNASPGTIPAPKSPGFPGR
jgi:hypothetical protein